MKIPLPHCMLQRRVLPMHYCKYFGEGNGTLFQYSCLENPMDGGAWKATVYGVAEGRTRLSDFTFTFHFHALEKDMATHSSVLARESQGRGSLVGCCLWVHTELDTTEVTWQQHCKYCHYGLKDKNVRSKGFCSLSEVVK